MNDERAAQLLREHDPARTVRDGAVGRVASRLSEPHARPRQLRLVLVVALVAAPMAFASLARGLIAASPAPVSVVKPVMKPAMPKPLPPAPPAVTASPPGVADEARALAAALEALERGDAEQAWCAVSAYRGAFPDGLLAPEADQLAERAAKGLGASRPICANP